MAMVAEHPNELVRDQYLMQVADRCRVEPARLRQLAGRARPGRGRSARAPRRSVRRPDDRRAGSRPRGRSGSPWRGPELEALRLAVHRPEAVADRLELVLFAHPLARACFEALSAATTLHDAIEAADPQAADLLQRLAVEDTDADTDDVMVRLVERAGQRALPGVQAEMRQAEPGEQAGFAPTVSWLKLTLEALRTEDAGGRAAALEAEQRLVGWLVARDQAEQPDGGDLMSEGGSTPFTPAGALTVDFVALLLLGRERGYLTPDDLISVMESVELTPALIAAAIGRVEAEGIEWRDDTDLGSETRSRGGARRRRPATSRMSRATRAGLTRRSAARWPRRPRSRPTAGIDGSVGPATAMDDGDTSAALARLAAAGTIRSRARASVPDFRVDLDLSTGGSSDPVRMYLKEIGKAKLLTAAEEVVLARASRRAWMPPPGSWSAKRSPP